MRNLHFFYITGGKDAPFHNAGLAVELETGPDGPQVKGVGHERDLHRMDRLGQPAARIDQLGWEAAFGSPDFQLVGGCGQWRASLPYRP